MKWADDLFHHCSIFFFFKKTCGVEYSGSKVKPNELDYSTIHHHNTSTVVQLSIIKINFWQASWLFASGMFLYCIWKGKISLCWWPIFHSHCKSFCL